MAYAEKQHGALTGKWLGQVRAKATGTTFRRAFDTRKSAEAYEAYVRMMGTEPPVIVEGREMPASGCSFADVAAACRKAGGPRGAWTRGRDKPTQQRLDYAIGRIGSYDIADITRALVRDQIIEPLRVARMPGNNPAKRRKQGTLNRHVSAVSAVLTWAEDEGLLKSKPRLSFPTEHDRVERPVITQAQEDAIVRLLEEWGRPIYATCIRVLAATGLRVGELYKLRPEQIEDGFLRLGSDTKTDRPRAVPIAPSLGREIRAIIASGALPTGTHLLKTFQKAGKLTGCESGVCLYSLRHSLNTRMRRAGVEEKIRMSLLGHTSAQVNRGYDHVDMADLLQAVEKARPDDVLEAGKVVTGPWTQPTQPIDKTG